MTVLNPRALRAGAAYAALMAGMIAAPAMAQVSVARRRSIRR